MQGLASLLHSALTLSLLASSPQRLQLPSILASRQLASSRSSDCFIGSIVEVVASLLLGFSYPTHTQCRLICINKTRQRGNTRRSLQCAVRDPAISGSGSGSLGAAACRQTSAALPQHQPLCYHQLTTLISSHLIPARTQLVPLILISAHTHTSLQTHTGKACRTVIVDRRFS